MPPRKYRPSLVKFYYRYNVLFRLAKWESLKRRYLGLVLGINSVYVDDVFIVSYPRSGNTWIRFFLANLLNPNTEISFRNLDNFIPDCYNHRAIIGNLKGRRFIKCHDPLFYLFPRVVYIYRDPRDALISYYCYSLEREEFTGSLEEFLSSRVVRRYTSWKLHTKQALDFSMKYRDRIQLICFEDAISEPVKMGSRIVDFLDIKASKAEVERALERSSFENLRRLEKEYGSETAGVTFFRKGRAGQWKDGINESVLSLIESENGELMSLLDYELS